MIDNIATIVAAYLRKNQVAPTELPTLISSVNQALTNLGKPSEAAPAALTPFVSIRRSLGADALICLDCGQKSKMLKRHLSTAHTMTPNEYRMRWGLASDYPMTAPNYTARRSELAKQIGLGSQGRRRTAS